MYHSTLPQSGEGSDVIVSETLKAQLGDFCSNDITYNMGLLEKITDNLSGSNASDSVTKEQMLAVRERERVGV